VTGQRRAFNPHGIAHAPGPLSGPDGNPRPGRAAAGPQIVPPLLSSLPDPPRLHRPNPGAPRVRRLSRSPSCGSAADHRRRDSGNCGPHSAGQPLDCATWGSRPARARDRVLAKYWRACRRCSRACWVTCFEPHQSASDAARRHPRHWQYEDAETYGPSRACAAADARRIGLITLSARDRRRTWSPWSRSPA